ncbi:hypothetical protein PR202_ga26990 [Eleusine coracana subsp. coracana]|uniref:Uncharacterized protein n=1 Tax=Eleusine coracana subsp. coracana TaxID=191504 RepID=A0AAV5DFK7_ELECO|nr:hypothetical protein PR202_ga26990 [Eleusine coracana subsp. coracana]
MARPRTAQEPKNCARNTDGLCDMRNMASGEQLVSGVNPWSLQCESKAESIASSPLQSSAAPLSRVVWIGREAAQALAPCFPYPQSPAASGSGVSSCKGSEPWQWGRNTVMGGIR